VKAQTGPVPRRTDYGCGKSAIPFSCIRSLNLCYLHFVSLFAEAEIPEKPTFGRVQVRTGKLHMNCILEKHYTKPSGRTVRITWRDLALSLTLR